MLHYAAKKPAHSIAVRCVEAQRSEFAARPDARIRRGAVLRCAVAAKMSSYKFSIKPCAW